MSTRSTLARDPGRSSVPGLILQFARAEMRTRARRLARAVRLQRLRDALPEDWQVPDSKLAQRATRAAEALCPDFIIEHSYRSYGFGALLAARNSLKLDRETFFVAAMLHDLGVSEEHKDDPGSFEWVGARLAHDFCLRNDETVERAAIVHDAIALHTSVGIADKRQPEIAMLHFGTGMDLFGMRSDEIPATSMSEILEAHPRDDFKARFAPCLQHQAESKPKSHIAGPIGMGMMNMFKDQLSE